MGGRGLVTVTVAAVVLALGGSGCSTSPAAVPPVEVVAPSTLDLVPLGRPPGTPDWRVTHPGPPHAIEGFADRTSALPGEPVRLFVSTTASTFTASAYRVGNYAGSEALQIWKSDPQPGVKQAGYLVQQSTRTVVAPWGPSLTLDTTGWQPGDYLIRLDGANGAQQFVPLTVRTQSNRGRIVIINAVTTWQAYNTWGGYSPLRRSFRQVLPARPGGQLRPPLYLRHHGRRRRLLVLRASVSAVRRAVRAPAWLRHRRGPARRSTPARRGPRGGHARTRRVLVDRHAQ